MKNRKCLQKILVLLVLFIVAHIVKGQNVDFTFSPDSASVGSVVTFTNKSDSVITNAMFVWKFENSKILNTHPPTYADEYDTARHLSNQISKFFLYPYNFNVTLFCIDSNSGALIATRTKPIIISKNACACSQNTIQNACNLICNNNFELYNETYKSSHGWLLGNLGAVSCDWWYATDCLSHGCPDLFNKFSNNPNVDIPTNLFGSQTPLSNNSISYAGFLAYRDADGYREYIQQDLYPDMLVAGQKYIVGMYVSLSDNSRYAIKDIGIALTNTCYQCCSLTDHFRYTSGENGSTNCAPLQPQVKAGNIIDNKTDWVLISDTIIGNNENTITIGNFSDNYLTSQNMYDYGSSYIIHYPGHDEYDAYYYVDSVFITMYHEGQNNNDTICIGNSITLTSSIVPDQNLYAWEYEWQPGSLHSNSITVSPTQNTTYICTATETANEGACSISDTFNVVPVQQAKPIIIGNNNNCDDTVSYTISNSNPNYTYSWLIKDPSYGNIIQPAIGSTITVHWNPSFNQQNTAYYTWLIAEITNTQTGCTAIDSIKIWKCCRYSDYPPVNDTVVTGAGIFYTNAVFNGTITINQTMTFAATDTIRMGPEARIIVNPPYTFKVYNSHIKNGCNYMWDGIYIKDSNAVFADSASGTIKNAINAVVSENGGKFRLKNIKFYNNYTSVLVRKYYKPLFQSLGAHKGKIYGCTFAKNGTGMIAPYLNAKPRHGVYLDNVYNITIGDSAQAANIFRNIFCGIASYNSIANVFKNDFRNIKIPVACQGGPTGDYTGLYCETAIHSVSTSNDLLHYNPSQLISGAGANSRNTFDTCSTAIYSYKTWTKVNNNKVKNTNIGVYCREATTSSYVINSTFKNNISIGVEFINILPLLKKITIKNDSILDPTMGIYLSNITSQPTNPALKTTVSNNYITNVKNSSVYGIRLEKCDYVEAYCNKITRATIPATAYRLLIRGIQIEQCANALIHDNTSERLGLSVKGAGSLLGTQFKCNTSDGSYYGFYFDALYGAVQTVISPQYNIQGTDTIPNDNKWYSIPATYYGIDANSSFTQSPKKKWYYRTTPSQYVVTEPTWLISYIGPTPKGNPIQTSCTTCGGVFMPGINSPSVNIINLDEIESIIEESNNYSELDESFKYFEKQYAYHKLDENTESLNAQTGQYYYNLKNSNIGRFDNVYRKIETGDIYNASLLNNQIEPVNTIEQYRKWANAVYLDYIVPKKEMPQHIIEDLETLASSSPFVNGDAVYSARAIVEYTEDEPEINNKSREIIPDTNATYPEKIEIKVYPNPANEYITLEIIGNNDKSIKFILINYLGIKVFDKTLNRVNTIHKIDTRKLKEGIYIYDAVYEISGESIYKGRIVICK